MLNYFIFNTPLISIRQLLHPRKRRLGMVRYIIFFFGTLSGCNEYKVFGLLSLCIKGSLPVGPVILRPISISPPLLLTVGLLDHPARNKAGHMHTYSRIVLCEPRLNEIPFTFDKLWNITHCGKCISSNNFTVLQSI